MLGNDYIDHYQVRALARAAGPSHVLGSRGKVRSLFFFKILKLEQLDDGIFFFLVRVVVMILPFPLPLSIEIIANCCIILSPAPRDWASLSCTAVRTINSKLPKDVHKWYQGEGKALRPIPIPIDLSTHTKKRLWECNSSSQVWSGRGGIHPVFTNIEQHRAKVLFFAYLYTSCNFDIYCWLRSPCPTFAATSPTKTFTYAAGISPKASLAFSDRWGIRSIIIIKKSHNKKIVFRVALVNVWPSCVHLGWPMSLPHGLAGWVARCMLFVIISWLFFFLISNGFSSL